MSPHSSLITSLFRHARDPLVQDPAEVFDESKLGADVVADAALVADPTAEAGAPEDRRRLAKVDHALVEGGRPTGEAAVGSDVNRLVVLDLPVVRSVGHRLDLVAPGIEVLVGDARPVAEVGIQADVGLVD